MACELASDVADLCCWNGGLATLGSGAGGIPDLSMWEQAGSYDMRRSVGLSVLRSTLKDRHSLRSVVRELTSLRK